jgi:SIR2-like protein
MKEADFKRLLNQLEGKQKCVLVLGPEFINIDSEEVDFTVSIHDYLVKKKFAETPKENYFSDDGFLLYDNDGDNYDRLNELGKFYKELKLTESYEKLARIPFTSIISLSPDDLMVQAYEKIKKDYTFCSYKNDGFEEGPLETSKTKPMIYNLAGHYDDCMNLVFTFDNLFKFLDKIFQDQGKDKLRVHIKEAANFLFFGFNYDKWYLKLIFYLLKKFRQEKLDFQRHAIFNYIDKEKEFDSKIKYYKASFKLNFSPENEKKFIETLYNSCREKGILSDVQSLQGIDINALKTAPTGKYRILFYGASPEGKMTLRSGEKYEDIDEALNKDFYELLQPKYKITKNDINKEVNRNFPNLIYFNCHGSDDGQLILSNEDNKPDYLPLENLKEMIDDLVKEHNQINCIVFAACKSEKQAKEISKIIPYCIGMTQTIYEDVSSIFTKGFFEGFIRDKQNIKYAFNMGVSAIKNCGNKDYEKLYTIPVLYEDGLAYEKEKKVEKKDE